MNVSFEILYINFFILKADLETHEGFMGGLQHNYQLKTAPYFANSICEVLFHVSTQMNTQNDQNKISKVGNFYEFIKSFLILNSILI